MVSSTMRAGLARATLVAAIAAGGIAAPALAHSNAPKLKYEVQVYAGALSLTDGYKDRKFAGAFVDFYSGDLGIHGDVIAVDREERATFAALGLSLPVSPHIRPKFMIGTSTANRAVLPEFFGMFEVQIKPGNDSGCIITPAVAYRSYRNSTHETRGSLALTKYFTVQWDHGGYYAAQGVVTIADNGTNRVRGSVVAGLQTVRKSGFSFGINGEVGGIASDPQIQNRIIGTYYSIRPNAAFPLFGPNGKLLLRGEYSDTDAYQAIGGTAGLKFEF